MASIESIDIGTVPRRARRALGLRARAQRNDFSSLRGLSGTGSRATQLAKALQTTINRVLREEGSNRRIVVDGIIGVGTAGALRLALEIQGGHEATVSVMSKMTREALAPLIRSVPDRYITMLGGEVPPPDDGGGEPDSGDDGGGEPDSGDDGGGEPDSGGDGGGSDTGEISLPLIIGVSVAATVGVVALIALARSG